MKITTICATVMSATVCALTSSTHAGGGALAWGYNGYGQTTVPNTAYSNVTAITGGYLHTIAIKNSGVLAWGSNDYGQTSVPNAASSGVTNIAAGMYHSLALTGGSLVAWGYNYHGQCTFPTSTPNSNISAIAAGSYHSLIVRNGTVFAFGWNDYGQCNLAGTQTGSGVTSVAGGYAHSAALKAGAVLAWGNNGYGQCTIPASANGGVTAIASGYTHTIALKGGEVLAWGDNYNGQCLGTDATGAAITTAATGTAVKINGVTLTGVTAIASGLIHTIALKNGEVLAWGDNYNGQCTTPTSATSGVTAIGAGAYHTVAVGVAIVDPCDVDDNGTPNADEPGPSTTSWLFPNITSKFENPANWSVGIPGYDTDAKITGNPQIEFGCDNSVKTLELSTNSTDSSPGMSLNLNSHSLTVYGGRIAFAPGAGTYVPYSVNIKDGFISPTDDFPLHFESDHATWNIYGTQLYSDSTELATIASSQIDVKLNNSTLNTAAITRGDLTDGSRHIELLNSSINDFEGGLTFGDGISLSLGSIMAGDNDYAQNSIVSYGVSGAVFQPGSLLDAWGNLSFVGKASFGGQLDLHAFPSEFHGRSKITVQGQSFNYGAGSSASAFAVMNVYGDNFNQPTCTPPECDGSDEELITLQLNYNGLASIGGPLFIHNTDGSIPAEGNLYTLIRLAENSQGAFDPNNNKFSAVRWVGQPLQNGLTFEQVLREDRLQLQCVRAPNVEPAPTNTTPLASVPFASASGDFTNDGRDDIVNLIVSASNSVQIMKDMGDGTFTQLRTFTLPAGNTPNAIAVGNATGDAELEIAVTSVENGVGFVGLYSATGTQIWKNQLGYRELPTCVCILNPYTLNGTSMPGQVILGTDNSGGNGNTPYAFVISGGLKNVSGDGTSSQNTPVIGVPRTVSGADIDPDDAPDVTTSGNAPTALTGTELGFIQQVKYTANGAQVGTPLMLSYVPVSIAIADMNGDGVKDICAACNSIADSTPAATRPVACIVSGTSSNGRFTMSPPTGISVGRPVQGKAVALVQRNGGFSLAVASTSTDGLNDSVDVIELNTFANGGLTVGNQTPIASGGNVIGLHTLMDQGTKKFATVRNVTTVVIGGFTSSAVIESTGYVELIYGDFDVSGIVDRGDLAYMLLSYGEAGITDLDGSGTTDSGDMAILLLLFN